MVHDLCDRSQHGIFAIAFHELHEPAFACRDSGNLCAQIAERSLREADVHCDNVNELLVYYSFPLIFYDGDLNALGVDICCHLAQCTANIEPMCHATGKSDKLTLVKDRH